MHFFTLLTAVLLTVTLAADPNCKHGVHSRGICCPKACGTCGGPDCGLRSRMTKDLCCAGSIRGTGRNCLTASAPCVITHTRPGHKAGSNKPDPKCETGIQKRKACCPHECSACGGAECLKRGRLIKSDCCVQSITKRNKSCSDRGPPCVVTEPEEPVEPTPEPLPAVCEKLTKPYIGGCFCHLTVARKILPKGRREVIKLCLGLFGTWKAIRKNEPKCMRFGTGKNVAAKQKKLVAKFNELIPICFPKDTPLISLRGR